MWYCGTLIKNPFKVLHEKYLKIENLCTDLVLLQETVHCLRHVGRVDGVVVRVRAVVPFFNEACVNTQI